MNFSQLHCFVALADTGSFTETAYTTHLTQSAVSHSLAALERELGVSLFERNRCSKKVALTEEGRRALEYAERLLALANEVQTVISPHPAAG